MELTFNGGLRRIIVFRLGVVINMFVETVAFFLVYDCNTDS